MKTLKDVKPGQTVTIVKLHGEGAVKRRIMDMGLTKGTEVYVRKVAPLGDPIEVNVRSYELSLRKAKPNFNCNRKEDGQWSIKSRWLVTPTAERRQCSTT